MNEHDEQEQGLVTVQPREIINVDQAVAEWRLYQELTQKLLDDSDYQQIGRDKFKKKSAWRKYAKAFNISCSLVKEEVLRADDGWPIFARIWARAEEPNGRFQVADQECHVTERCCPKATGGDCTRRHDCCQPGCDGRKHFSHPGDVAATAVTRAKNRAISDLIGAGEVSAEEADAGDGQRQAPRRANGPAQRSFDEPPHPAEAEAPAPAAGSSNGITKPQIGKIRAMLGKAYPGDEQAQFEWVERVQPSAVAGTEVTLGDLTKIQASAMIDELEALTE